MFIEENVPEVTIEDDVALDNNNRIFIAAEENKTIKLAVGTEDALDISIDVYSKLKGEHVTVEIYDSIGTSKVFKVAAINLRNAEAIERDSPYPIQIRVSINTGRLTIQRDLNYLFYTRDVEYNDLPLILSADSFEEESRSDVIAYPNPFDGFISFKNEEEILAFTLTDASGKLIFQRASQVEAPVKMPAELLPGIYTCTVKTRRGTAQFKLVKK